MKRMWSILLTAAMFLSLLPMQAFAADTQASADPEYQITGISLVDGEGREPGEIPADSFRVEVSLRALTDADDALLLLAAYTAGGQYLGLSVQSVNAETESMQLSVDNSAGKVAELRAFVVRSMNDMAPLSAMGTYPWTVADLQIEESRKQSGGVYQNVTITEDVGNGEVTLKDLYIHGDLTIRGGGSQSVKLVNCVLLGKVIMDKATDAESEPVRLELTNTPIEEVELIEEAIIEATDEVSAIASIEASGDVEIRGGLTVVEEIRVETDEAVAINIQGGMVETIVAASPVTISGEKNAVDTVIAKAAVTVDTVAVKSIQIDTDEEITIVGDYNTEVVVNTASASIIIEGTGNDSLDHLEFSSDLETPPAVTVNGQDVHVHRWVEQADEYAAPACKSDGQRVYVCANTADGCSKRRTEILSALGHDYGEWFYLNDREHQRICANDADHVEEWYHTWDEGVITAEPTNTAPGVKTYTCDVCGGTTTEQLPPLGQAVAAPQGIANIERNGAGFRIEMDPPKDLANIEYFRMSFIDSTDPEGSRRTDITCPASGHNFFYYNISAFDPAYQYDKAEITAIGMNGYANGVWTGDVVVDYDHTELENMKWFYDADNQPAPLLGVDFGVTTPESMNFEIRAWAGDTRLPNEYYSTSAAYRGLAAARTASAEEIAAVAGGTVTEVTASAWAIDGLTQADDGTWKLSFSTISGETTVKGDVIKIPNTDEDPDDTGVQTAEITFTNEAGIVTMNWSTASAPDTTGRNFFYDVSSDGGQTWSRVGHFASLYATADNHMVFTSPDLSAGSYNKVRVGYSEYAPDYREVVWFVGDCDIAVSTQSGTATAVIEPDAEREGFYTVTVSGLTYTPGQSSRSSKEIAFRDPELGAGHSCGTISSTTDTFSTNDQNIPNGEYRIREYHNITASGNSLSFTIYEGTWKKCISGGSGEVPDTQVAFSVYGANGILRLNWTAKPDYTGVYYVNGVSTYNTAPLYFLANDIRNATQSGKYSYTIQTTEDNGATLDTWAVATDIVEVVVDNTAVPDLAVVGQANGSYRFVPNGSFTGTYNYTLYDPDGGKIFAFHTGPNTETAVAPFENCCFAVREVGWPNGTFSGPVTVTVSGEKNFSFTPYDFSTTVASVNSDSEADLTAALNKGGKVTLNSNVTITNSRINKGGDVILDLNGYTVDIGSRNSWCIENGKKVTVIDSSTAGTGKIVGTAGISVGSGCTLVCDGIELARVYNGGSYGSAKEIRLDNCTLTYTAAFRDVKNVSMTNTVLACSGAQINFRNADAVLNKCTLTSDASTSALDLYGDSHIELKDTDVNAAYVQIYGGTLTVNGGTYTDNPEWKDAVFFRFQGTAGKVVINSGTFNFDPTEWVREGRTITENGDGTYTVTAE